MKSLINDFSMKAGEYIDSIGKRKVFPSKESVENLKNFDIPLQEAPVDPLAVLDELHKNGSPATVATTGNRYFGFVIGGTLPAAMAANLLAGVWDQNAGLEATSPVASTLEEVCRKWLIDLFNLPQGSAAGFVTGATMANFTALAAARHALLKRAGWNVAEDGLFGAPPINVIVGEEVHVSVLKALSMLGLGKNRVTRVQVDDQGRMKPELIPRHSGPTLVCIQAGNVNTGAFDRADQICKRAQDMNAWVHVDGAFGLWALAAGKEELTKGIELAHSWATDSHKWLNVPYDSGIVLVREPSDLVEAMATTAAYFKEGMSREPFHYVPELSRRARGIEVWASLRSLGKSGVRDLINRNCDYARKFAGKLQDAGIKILNEVVLNQILVSFGDPDLTKRIIGRIQDDGTCWCGGTVWQNQTAMRISISSWRTTEEDIILSADTIIRIVNEEKNQNS